MDHPMKVGSRPGASMKTEGEMLDRGKKEANLDFVAHRTLVKMKGLPGNLLGVDAVKRHRKRH
jgi:hypothetical protein